MAHQQSSSGLAENAAVSSDVTDYVKYLKLAVAVAVIRSRPAGMTGQQYAEQLCARYQRTQLNWKQEAQRLKQQLNVVLQQNSAFGQLHEHVLTPPSSMEAACPATSTVRHSDPGCSVLLSRHLAFLAGVLSLDSVADHATTGHRAAPANDVVASTIQLVVDAVLRRLERCHDDDDDVMSHSAALYAVDIVARVCDVTDASVCDVVQRFVRNVVDYIMNNQLLNQSQRQQAACDYLLSLLASRSLQPRILDVLLDAVADVADRLRRTGSAADDYDDGASVFPPAWQLENVAYVLDCAERVLSAAGCSDVGGSGVEVELCRRLSAQLDLSLRHVASAFPLFAFGVWQLGGLVDCRQRSGKDETTPPD